MARSIRGVRTHISAPKINTACTTPSNNNPYTFGYSPSQIRILVIRVHLFLSFLMLSATSGQSSSLFVSTLPRYLNNVTVYNGYP